MNRSIRRAGLAAALALAALPAAASAHVTLQPAEGPAGTFKRLDVRVPNERDDAATTKVVVQFPEGFESVSHQPVPGWTATVKMAGQRVDTLTFATKGKGIAPGQFQDFGISVRLPEEPGTSLTFKALQTYSSGEVVRWIGEPGSDEPAPQVRLTEAPGEEAAAHGPAASATPAAAVAASDDGGSDALAIVALIVGALGLAAGVAGLAAARRARTAVA